MITEKRDVAREEIHRHVRDVISRVERACERAGRRKDEVKIIAVSKTFPSEFIQYAWEAGISDFGENYVQEALEKIKKVGEGTKIKIGEETDKKITWHFVGRLQTNKAKFIPGNFEFVHSVDSIKLVKELEKRCARKSEELGKHVGVKALVQINIAKEPTKSGILPEKVSDFFKEVMDIELKYVRLCGLMIIPPPPEKPEDSRKYFRELREMKEKLVSVDSIAPHMVQELSMGMTDDFEVAVEEGATMLRIGRAIFFEREKKPHSQER